MIFKFAICNSALTIFNRYDGNSFNNGPAPPLPPYNPPPPGRSHSNRNHSRSGTNTPDSKHEASHSDKGLTVGALIGLIVGSVFVVLIMLPTIVFCIRKNRKNSGPRAPREVLSVGSNTGRFSFSFSLGVVSNNI